MLGAEGRCFKGGVGQAREFFLVFNKELEGVGCLQVVLAELYRQCGQLYLQRRESLLCVGIERGAVPFEGFIYAVEQHLLLASEFSVMFADMLHASEQFLVEQDAVAVLGEHGRELGSQHVHLVVSMGAEQVEEDVCSACQQFVCAWQDGVFEGGLVGIVCQQFDGFVLLAHAFEYGWLEVGCRDAVEGDAIVWRAVFGIQ